MIYKYSKYFGQDYGYMFCFAPDIISSLHELGLVIGIWNFVTQRYAKKSKVAQSGSPFNN